MNAPSNPTEMPSLEEEYQGVQIRASENWAFVHALRECFGAGLPHMQPALVPYLDNSIRTTMGASFPKINETRHIRILEGLAAHKVQLAQSLMDAATIVIIQATLDSAVNDYLVLLARADPATFEPEVDDEPLPLRAVRDKPYAELLQSRALAYAKSVSAKSLPNKIQLILDHCYRAEVELFPSGFRFDLARVRAFDDLRHDIAHGRGLGITIQNMDEVLIFLWQTLLSLEAVVGFRLTFTIDRTREFKRPLKTVHAVTL
jgi:hypothetical protein